MGPSCLNLWIFGISTSSWHFAHQIVSLSVSRLPKMRICIFGLSRNARGTALLPGCRTVCVPQFSASCYRTWSEARLDGAHFAFDTLFVLASHEWLWRCVERSEICIPIIVIVCHGQGRSRPGHELEKYLRKLVAARDPICPCKNMGTNESCVNDRDMWLEFCFETILPMGFVWIFGIFTSFCTSNCEPQRFPLA